MNLTSKLRETCRVGRVKLCRPSREEVCADISGSNEIKYRISAQIENHIDHMRVHYSVPPQPDHPSRKSLDASGHDGKLQAFTRMLVAIIQARSACRPRAFVSPPSPPRACSAPHNHTNTTHQQNRKRRRKNAATQCGR